MEFGVYLNKKDWPDAKVPVKKNQTDAGFDISSAEHILLLPGERKLIHTGVHFLLKPGWEAQIRSRSGLAAKNGVLVLNSPGTIDADYRGEAMVVLYNSGKDDLKIIPGDRIAQVVIKEVPVVSLKEVDTIDVNETSRGSKGFGSSGV